MEKFCCVDYMYWELNWNHACSTCTLQWMFISGWFFNFLLQVDSAYKMFVRGEGGQFVYQGSADS